MKEKTNSILVDFDVPEDWSFFKGLNSNDRKWIIEAKISNWSQKSKLAVIRRYFAYFTFSFHKFLHIKNYKRIIAWQQFYGIFLCYFLRIFHKKCDTEIVLLTFIYKKKKGFLGKIYHSFVSKALSCPNLKKIVVLSKHEIEHYSLLFDIPKENFQFFRIGIDETPKFNIKKGEYFLSAGRSNRDYDFLVNVFRKLEYKLFIVSDTYKNNDLPNNVKILDSCFGDDYQKLIAGCFAMIISLTNDPVSSGQLVINWAYLYKKPVIVTNNPGIIDYIDDGKNGYIIEKDKKELCNAINKLMDSKEYMRISENSISISEFEYGKNVDLIFSL